MNILVCECQPVEGTGKTITDWQHVRTWGNVVEFAPCTNSSFSPDIIVSMSISAMEETYRTLAQYPTTPLICYNWDCYEWVWTNPRPDEYNYDRYGELIKNSVEVWVPSECTKAKLSKWWDIHPDKVKVILSAVPYWNYPDVQDKGYVMCALREIPDHWWGKFEQACEELNIPYLATKHLYTYADYQEAVAHCKFLVSPLYELSTGGLTLVEGYYLGKPCLLSDSPWHGGIDYMHDKATYFDHANFSDFKSKLQEMYTETPQLDIKECKEWVKYNFSSRKMMYEIWRRLETVYTGL